MGSGAPFSLRVCFVDPLRKVCRVEIVRSIREYPVHPMLRIVWLALLAACSSYADERHNLIEAPSFRKRILELRTRLFEELEESGALEVPFRVPAGERLDQRKLR